MVLRRTPILLLMLMVVGLSACGAAAGKSDCPTAAAGQELLTDEEHGYCLLYPAGLEVFNPNENETVLIEGSLLNVEGPRVYIRSGDASGRTAEELADELAAEVPEGFPIQRASLTLDGETAVMLDNLPSQDMNRMVVVVHSERSYQFTFVPVGKDYGELSALTEKLYEMVVGSFWFVG
jgi:hypothetical protein